MTILENKKRGLQQKLKQLDEQIAAAKQQLPAHSVKPPLMIALLDLEDERDAVLKELEKLKSKSGGK